MKKTYQIPETLIITVAPHAHILDVSGNHVTSVSNNAGINTSVSGGSEDARTKEYNVWDDDWSE